MAAESAASRDDLARQAEKHLRQGRTDLALELYERLAQFAPTDWNTVKQLADLLERAGRKEAAAGRFLECADHHFTEGFHARAAALYRKVLKLEPMSEHALCQLAEVSLALKLKADARMAFGQVLSLRQRRGDPDGAEAISRRLAELDEGAPAATAASTPAASAAAPSATSAAAPVAPTPEEVTRRLREVAEEADARGDVDGAGRAWLAVLHREPADRALRHRLVSAALDRQDLETACPLLDGYAALDPEGLAWRFEVAQRTGRSDQAQEIAERIVRGTDAGDDPGAILSLAHAVRDLLRARHATLADAWCSRVIEALVQPGRQLDAVRFIEDASARHPLPIECHLRWVELCVDGGLEGLDRAQFTLASAYLHSGQPDLARAVGDDLLVRQPDLEHIRTLVLMIHQACGEPDPERSVQQLLAPAAVDVPATPMWQDVPETPVAPPWALDPALADVLVPPLDPTPEPTPEPIVEPARSIAPPPLVVSPPIVTPTEPVLPAFAAFDWGALLGREPAPLADAAPVAATEVPQVVPPDVPADVAPDVAVPGSAQDDSAVLAADFATDFAPETVSADVFEAAAVVAPLIPEPTEGVSEPALAPEVPVPAPDVVEVDDQPWTLLADASPDPDEIDLTELLEQLQPHQVPVPSPAEVPAVPSTDEPGGEAEALAVDEPPGMLAAQQVAAGRVFAAAGLAAEAARAFERATRDARSRFEAAEALAGLHRSRGQLAEAIRWYDEAAHAPVPDAADRRPVLYDLAETLEAAGQPDRALAVLLDLLSEVEDYRDARARADRLLRVDAGG